MAFHDLTPNQSAPPDAKTLLGLGPKFVCTPKTTTGSLAKNFERFERDFFIKVIYAGEDESPEDGNLTIDRDISKLYVKSKWKPQPNDVPSWCIQRLSRFFSQVQRLFVRKNATSNLFRFQERLLQVLAEHPQLLFPLTDKGLGPCSVEYDQYVKDCLRHLLNSEVYQQLSESEATLAAEELDAAIAKWLTTYRATIGRMAHKFIDDHRKDNSGSPFGQFYILYKIHKGKNNDGTWPTRHVCSDVTSLPHALGKWITEQLVPIQ